MTKDEIRYMEECINWAAKEAVKDATSEKDAKIEEQRLLIKELAEWIARVQSIADCGRPPDPKSPSNKLLKRAEAYK